MSLLELFYHVDDFCQANEADWKRQQLASGERQRQRQGHLWLSEIMTIVIHFHQVRFRDFKTYYQGYVKRHLSSEFPHLVSYNRFVELMAEALVPLSAYLQSCYGTCTGIAFIDSTPLAVCDNRRIGQHRTFRDLAQRGKNSMGWFYGFKLHLVVNERGELLACRLSAGNVDDRTPVPKLVHRLFGWLYADKGYLSQALVRQLVETYRLYLVTHARRNMKNHLLSLSDRLLLRKRAILETITDQLKNISQIEHTRHRSFTNFCVNLLAGLIAYCHQPKKPALHLDLYPRLDDFIPN
ncbi:MAG: IS982 family transposase [Anaerolineae bacterium]|nr:IS982 family transposase [Anaerolineae bacterium]